MSFIYQVFPDRFAIGSSEPRDLGGFERPASWDALPRPVGNELYGGDLDGIAAHLDHVKELGASALYLTPIFDAPSSHRYDARSFRAVDPRLGGDAAFDRLVQATRSKDLGLILDAVFNHTGEQHPWLRERPDFYGTPPIGWRGHGHLPELRLENEALRAELFTGPESVVRTWLRRGATGWRIDCANDLGLEACALVRRAAAQEGARDGVTGEVMAWAAPYLRAGALDGVMNYYFREAVVGALRGDLPAEQTNAALAEMARAYPLEGLLRSWNMVGSHDTPRLKTLLGSRVRAALLLAFVYPGVPVVYYGDEIGLEGGEDPDCRRTMPWDRARWDARTFELVRSLSRLRREQRALREGTFVPLVARGAIAFARATGDPRETAIVLVNTGEARSLVRVLVPRSELVDSLPLVDPLSGRGAKMRSGALAIELEAGEGVILLPRPLEAGGYDFMKRAVT